LSFRSVTTEKMKKFYRLKIHFKKYFCLFIFISVLFFNINMNNVDALPMETFQSDLITEELRLRVPFIYKQAWLTAEKNIWEPWLSGQDGFLGRQIFWNKEKEEALILVNWENKKFWKNINMNEVNEIQEKFEENVKASLDLNENPFQLIYEGELHKQE